MDNTSAIATLEDLKAVIRDVVKEFVSDDEKPAQVRERDKVTGPEQRVLDTLNWLEHVTARAAFKPDIVAYFARQQTEAPSFKNARRDLRRKGFVDNTYAGWMQLTEAGRALSKTEMYVNRKTEQKTTELA